MGEDDREGNWKRKIWKKEDREKGKGGKGEDEF